MRLRRQAGFTLMEIIIALFIFTIIMAMVISGFSVVLRSNERVRQHHARLSEIQLAVTVLTRDLSQLIERGVRDNDGANLAAIISEEDGRHFEFSRGGYINPFSQAKRSTLLRVAYYLNNNTIVRAVWPVLDRAPSTESINHPILTGVSDFSIVMLNKTNEILPDGSYEEIPQGIILTIELENAEKITRIIATTRTNNA